MQHQLVLSALNTEHIILQSTYEELRLNEADVGDKTKWLKEGMDCNLLFWKGKVNIDSDLNTFNSIHIFLFWFIFSHVSGQI